MTQPTHRTSGPTRPQVMVFDVNETLSDMRGMATAFAAVGAPARLAGTWFASVLRDGFALTATGANPDFADVARFGLTQMLTANGIRNVDAATTQVMDAFMTLPVHADVVAGVRALADAGIRLVTLSNGSASVAQGLLERAGVADRFERLLSVQDAPGWKPAGSAYAYALETCNVSPADAMLVAVHPWDIHGAHQAGLATAFVNRASVTYPSYFAAPDVEVASLLDLASELGATLTAGP